MCQDTARLLEEQQKYEEDGEFHRGEGSGVAGARGRIGCGLQVLRFKDWGEVFGLELKWEALSKVSVGL